MRWPSAFAAASSRSYLSTAQEETQSAGYAPGASELRPSDLIIRSLDKSLTEGMPTACG